MGNRSLKKYLYDVQQSIDSIYEYLGIKGIASQIRGMILMRDYFNSVKIKSCPVRLSLF